MKRNSTCSNHEKKLLSKQSEDYPSYIELVVDVLKTQNQSSLTSLKNFLTCLASPTAIEAVLAAAIYQLAEVDLDAYCWILNNRDDLMPELDLVELATNCLQHRLEKQGLVLGKDFQFLEQGKLQFLTKKKVSNQFWEEVSQGEVLIFEKILLINKFNFP